MEGHFLPEDLARTLESRGYRVSLTTVYRNMPLLVEAGIVRRTCISEGGAIRYERVLGSEHHDHLICSRCGLKIEFTYPAIDVLQEEVARSHGFELERHHLELIGLCPDCRRDRSTDG
jgi:Fur family ferric uptake transcriptional regulator